MPKKYYYISEVANMFDTDIWTIRLWSNKFFDILKSRLDKNGNLTFSTTDLKKIETICRITKEKKMTLNEVREYMLSAKNKNQTLLSVSR